MIAETQISKQFFPRMFYELSKDPTLTKYNKLCANGFEGHKGDTPCAYNVAAALINTKRLLETQYTTNIEDWKWGNLMTLEFQNMPWSSTFLRVFFHRSRPSGGNENTVNVAEYALSEAAKDLKFRGKNAPNYKQIIQLN